MTSKTIALTGDETRVDYGGGTNVWLRNDGTDAIYASTSPGITAGADGTVSIPAGQSVGVYGANGTVYLIGTGSVQLIGSDYSTNPFRNSAASGGSGADEVARAAIGAHAGNADIHVTADEKAEWNGKADKSDIPTTLPANGGNAETLDGLHVDDLIYARGILENIDLDTIKYPCSALANVSCTNKPVDEWGTFLAFVGGSGSVSQLYIPTVVDGTQSTLWMRHFGGTGWSAWRNVSNGGNAETLDELHESSFAQNIGTWSEGNIKDSLLSCQRSGFVWIQPGVTGMPYDGTYWFGTVNCTSVHRQLTVSNISNTAVYTISWNNGEQSWEAWKNIADGGNADTLDGKHAEDFKILTFVDNNADVTCIEARRDNTVIRLQIQTNMEIARYFKSTDGGTSWTELPLGAATNVGAYTEEKLVALEARIAALEGGGT